MISSNASLWDWKKPVSGSHDHKLHDATIQQQGIEKGSFPYALLAVWDDSWKGINALLSDAVGAVLPLEKAHPITNGKLIISWLDHCHNSSVIYLDFNFKAGYLVC